MPVAVLVTNQVVPTVNDKLGVIALGKRSMASNHMPSIIESLSSFWVHFLLIGGDVVATVAVGWGIIWEAPEQSSRRHRIAKRLVIWGIAAETLCSVTLFAYDESVSQALQAEVISLQLKLLPRSISPKQWGEMATALVAYRPFAVQVSPLWETPEITSLARQLTEVPSAVGERVGLFPPPQIGFWFTEGVEVMYPACSAKGARIAEVWVEMLNANGISAVMASDTILEGQAAIARNAPIPKPPKCPSARESAKGDNPIILVWVGEKPK